MFGITSFAKAPFAALGVAFNISQSENINLAETETITAQFSTSLIDNITLADASTQTSTFSYLYNENSNLANTQIASQGFYFTQTEPITNAETESITAKFNATIVEAWGQTPYSVPQQPSIASFAMAGSPFAGSFNTVGYLENPSYIVQANLLDSITENLNIVDTPSINAQFSATIVEAWGQTPYSVPQNPLTFAGFAMAGSPFAGNFNTNGYLENPSYVVQANLLDSIIEKFGIDDFNTQTFNFLESLTEATTVAEIDTIIAGFAESIIENATIDNTQTITAQFAQAIAEAVTMADLSTQQSAFLESIIENFNILDSYFVTGWITIDDSQTVLWAQVNDNQSVTWDNINNTQSTSWNLIDNSQ